MADIRGETSLSSLAIYRVLARLEALQRVDSDWEQPSVRQQRWPRRGYHGLSTYGLAMARGALASARASPVAPNQRLRPAAGTS